VWLLLGLVGTFACGAAVDDVIPISPPPPPPPAPAPQFHIEPANSYLLLGASLQLRAVLPNGEAAGVLWRMDEPTAGTLTAGGLFTPTNCGEVGIVHVHAIWPADTSLIASTTITLQQTAVGIATITAINLVPDGGTAQLDSLNGAVEVRVGLSGIRSQCTEVAELRLVLEGLTVTTLGSASFDPPTSGPAIQTFAWNTTGVPNGSYRLKVLYRQPGKSLDADGALQVQIRNYP
jgi:hypothetical protein